MKKIRIQIIKEKKFWKKAETRVAVLFLCLLFLGSISAASVTAHISPGLFPEMYKKEMSEEITQSIQGKDSIAEPENLYAQAAVLMDGDSGRVLFEKEGSKAMPMASTTKIMTCILALEHGNLDDIVTVSANAAAQPEVHLGAGEGKQFYLRDLLYSLMLESHNDSAVMIAEHIGVSEEGFADMMNQKAKEIGCVDTFYITPNGLDAENENGIHHTTAEDLARVMKYCVRDSGKRDLFLEITQTLSYQFSEVSGQGNYTCNNHNALLNMISGVLSGKTGFTGNAGYCYVGAVENEGRTFIVSLLACGWPNNKSYKWADSKKLLNYGAEHYHYRNIYRGIELPELPVVEGIPDKEKLEGGAHVSLKMTGGEGMLAQTKKEGKHAEIELRVLLRDDEEPEIEIQLEKFVQAPVFAGKQVGGMRYLLGDTVLYSCKFVTESDVGKRNLVWCMDQIVGRFLNQR